MSDREIVVVDAGSTRIRCFVFGANGEIAAQGSAAWNHVVPDVPSPYVRELDGEAVWDSTTRLIAKCVGCRSVYAPRIAAITVTSQRQGVVFLDREDRVLYAGPNVDLRAVFEGAAIDDEMRDRVYEVTGRLPSFLFAAAKLRWFMNNRPDVYDRIDRVVTLADWLRWKLSGELASEATLAAEAGLLDIRNGRWCGALFDELGVRANASVPIERAGAVIGKVRPEAADRTGVREGVPVVVSPADTQCGLLGLGVGQAGQVGIVAGWSIPLLMLTDAPTFDKRRRTWTSCYVDEGLWSIESTCGDAGNSYRWLADVMWAGEPNPFDSMDAAAQEVPAGSDGVLAYLGASRMYMENVGLRAGGFMFPVPVTFNGIGRGHLARAALESIAFAARANLEQLECVSGTHGSKIAVGGGMIGTSSWVEMLPNVLGRSVEVASDPNVTAAGAYVTAVAALGGLDSISGKAEATATTTAIDPRPVESAEYDAHYRRWTEMALHLESANT